MLVIRVELHSAITGKISEIARMIVANDSSGTKSMGNYWGVTADGEVEGDHMIPAAIVHETRKRDYTEIKGYDRSLHVWNLVTRMLTAMGYE